MAKRLICFPFVDGSLQEYSFNELDDDERARVYNGEEVATNFVYDKNKKVIWKPNEEVELTLRYKGYGRGRSAVTFYWVDENGHNYPMFIKDVDELLRQDMGTSSVHAIFTYVKRGANYGIKFVRRVEDKDIKLKEAIKKLAGSIPSSTKMLVKANHQFEKETNELISALSQLGIVLANDNGEYRSTSDVLNDIAERLNDNS